MQTRTALHDSPLRAARVAVVIPCYRVEQHICDVIRTLPATVGTIVVVDDCSPDRFVERVLALGDPRVVLLRHRVNQGVGGAMLTGYRECLQRDVDIVVKMDGDGQMDPAQMPALLRPLLEGRADYTKGNRWHDLHALRDMPAVRRLGNAGLSFLTKLASGYWRLFDPCNGYTAIRTSVLRHMPLDQLARSFFFETSMLLQLNILSAVVRDVAMPARYGDEVSSLKVHRILWQFPRALVRGGLQRIWTRHFVREFSAIAPCLLGGLLGIGWGVGFGSWHWLTSVLSGAPATAGTVMLSAMPLLMGFQLLLQAGQLEIALEPTEPLSADERLGAPVPALPADHKAAA